MKIAGKVCVVTGGASDIGKALATRFIAEGAKAVVIADLNADTVSAVGAEIGAQAHALDVRDESAIAALVASVETEHGQIDLFCSNAGIIGVDGEPWWATGADNALWRRMWEIHLMSHVYAARACLPAMIAEARATSSIQRRRQVCSHRSAPAPIRSPSMRGIVCREFGDHPRG